MMNFGQKVKSVSWSIIFVMIVVNLKVCLWSLLVCFHRGHYDPTSQTPHWSRDDWQLAETEAGPEPLGEISLLPTAMNAMTATFISSDHILTVSVISPPAGQTAETHSESQRLWTGSFSLWSSRAGKNRTPSKSRYRSTLVISAQSHSPLVLCTGAADLWESWNSSVSHLSSPLERYRRLPPRTPHP